MPLPSFREKEKFKANTGDLRRMMPSDLQVIGYHGEIGLMHTVKALVYHDFFPLANWISEDRRQENLLDTDSIGCSEGFELS